MTDANDDEAHAAEDRRRHLDYLQAVITRMSSASSTTKGWLLPVITATYGYALTAGDEGVAMLGLMGVALFALMDANYLGQERAFRALYDRVARLKAGDPVPAFAMNPAWAAPSDQADDGASTRKSLAKRAWTAIRDWFPDGAVWSSWAIAPFYGPLALLGVVLAAALFDEGE